MSAHPFLTTVVEANIALKRGDLVAIPTETVYGLAGDAKNPDAVKKIFALKGRPANHPLIVHIGGAEQLPQWALKIPDAAYRLAERFWPGPLTFILNKRGDVPIEVTGGQNTVGLRCPNNTVTLDLLKQFGGGLAAPSANRFGRISPTTAQHVVDEFGAQSPLILDGGPCSIGIESTIVDLSQSPPRILRHGNIRFEQLQAYLPELQTGIARNSPRVSGSLEAHYAPLTPMRILHRNEIMAGCFSNTLLLALDALPDGMRGIALPNNAERYAQMLYAALRQLDAMHADMILVEQLPDDDSWLAIADRIKRASKGSIQSLHEGQP